MKEDALVCGGDEKRDERIKIEGWRVKDVRDEGMEGRGWLMKGRGVRDKGWKDERVKDEEVRDKRMNGEGVEGKEWEDGGRTRSLDDGVPWWTGVGCRCGNGRKPGKAETQGGEVISLILVQPWQFLYSDERQGRRREEEGVRRPSKGEINESGELKHYGAEVDCDWGHGLVPEFSYQTSANKNLLYAQ